MDRGFGFEKKKILSDTISFFLENYNGWLKLMSCSYTVENRYCTEKDDYL